MKPATLFHALCALALMGTTPTASPAAPTASAVQAAELAAPPLRFAAPVIRTLANGLRVAVFPQKGTALVQVQLMVPAGSGAEGAAPQGVASLTAQMLRLGTASRTGQQFSLDLEQLGGVFNVSVTRDAAMVAGGFRAGDLGAGLELISDAVLNPLFDPESFEALRRQSAQQLGMFRRNGSGIADERAWAALFGPHPYARSQQGAIDALFATKGDHLRAFHRDRWRPDRAVLAVTGDVSPEQVFAAAQERFGHWAGRTTPDPVRPAPAPISGVRVIDAREAPAAEIRWGALAPGRADPSLPAWTLLAAALNEDPSLPPGTRVQLVTLVDASLLLLSAPSPLSQAGNTAKRLHDAIEAMASAPPKGPALDAVRTMVARSWPLSLESPGAQLTAWLNTQLAGQPADELSRTASRYADSGRREDLAAAAAALRTRARLVVVGPADSLTSSLRAFGAVQVEPVDRPIVAGADTLAAPSAAELQRGRQLVEQAATAHGGAARLRNVKSMVVEGEMLAITGQNELSGQFSTVRVHPSRLAFNNKILEFESRQVLDGRKGWMLAQADTATLSEADSAGVESMQNIFESDLVNTLRGALAPGSRVAARGKDKVNGHDCDLVDFVTARGVHTRMALEQGTRRVAAIDGALGADLIWHERRVFTDVRPVGGLMLPFTEQRFVDGTLLTTMNVRKVRVDGPIDESIFRMPMVRRGRVIGR
ncbi:MAG: pitrilysin family protein [Candidatus Eisenbacteria bacterium]